MKLFISFLCLGYYVVMRPLWLFPVRRGWIDTAEQLRAFGDSFGMGAAVNRMGPALEFLHARGVTL